MTVDLTIRPSPPPELPSVARVTDREDQRRRDQHRQLQHKQPPGEHKDVVQQEEDNPRPAAPSDPTSTIDLLA